MTTPVVVVGAGGHASDVLGCIEAINAVRSRFAVLGFVDDDGEADGARLTARGVGRLTAIPPGASIVIGVGYPAARVAVARRLSHPLATLVHPSAEVGSGTSIGDGAQVLGGAHLSALVELGDLVLVSYLAAVGHDSIIGEGSSLMPGAIVSGDCRIGAGVLIGSNATVLEGVSVGDGASVGAGAVVTADVPPGVTVTGVPGR